MDYKKRQQRVRRLVRKVNKERKKQAQKIDILCNDIITAQKDFIKKLDTISFAADFYESILGTTELDRLFAMTERLISNQLNDAQVSFFLRSPDNFELYMLKSNVAVASDEQQFESFFTQELVEDICKSNKTCNLDELCAMGLQINPAYLSTISAVTIPLGNFGISLGFLLICRSSKNKLSQNELKNITAITPGFSEAIKSCQTFQHATN